MHAKRREREKKKEKKEKKSITAFVRQIFSSFMSINGNQK